MPSTISQKSRFIGIETPLGKDKLGLIRFSGEEQISRPFQFEAEMVSEDAEIDFDKIVGQPVTLRLDTKHGGPRYFHGHACCFTQLESRSKYARYRMTVVPWLWFLTRTSDCRIYQGKTIRQIVEDVFKRQQFTDFQWSTTGNYGPWEYCVQYRETDFNFVSRLLEQEGIYYFFNHEQNRHTLVLCDGPSGHEALKGYENVTYRPSADGTTSSEYIFGWNLTRRVQTGAYEHADYDFLKPTSSLNSSQTASRNHAFGSLACFDYPGEYNERNDGQTWAQVRLQELQVGFESVEGRGDTRGIAAGHTFTLKDPPRKDQARKYLLLWADQEAEAGEFDSERKSTKNDDSYRCSFRAMDAAQTFRPARLTPKPVVQGPQTATVVGPSGKEIWVDEHARVKVHFHWDRHNPSDDSASCWMRVAQPWAGKGYGGLCIPRIGQEVVVEFLEGDPDQPIINGRVYNANSMPPVSNAGRDDQAGNVSPQRITDAAMMTSIRSQSLGGSGGHNEITMNDAAGKEGLFIKAQKDEIHNVGNDRQRTVVHDETVKIGNDQQQMVGNNKTVEVGSNLTEDIGKHLSLKVGMTKNESVGLASSENVGAAKALNVGGAYAVNVAGAMNEAVGEAKTVEVGLQHAEVVGKDRTLNVGKKLSIQAGDEITVTTGKASIVMKKDGTIQIKGKDITIEGSGEINAKASKNVTLKGQKILQN